MEAQWKTKDNQGRNVLCIVFKYENTYFFKLRRWIKPGENFEVPYVVLREYNGYKYIEVIQCNLRDTWFKVCAAILDLEKNENV